METNYKYKNLAERKVKITVAENKGLRMLHDTFDPDWKPGQEPHGTIIFTDDPEPAPVVEPAPRDLAKEIDDLKVTLRTKGIL